MRDLIEEITNSRNFEKFFCYSTGDLGKLSSVLYKAKDYAERELTTKELEELRDYFIEHIKGNAQTEVQNYIERNSIDIDDFSFTDYEQEWIDTFVDI